MRFSFTSDVKEFNRIQCWMSINHKCVKKKIKVVIWLFFLCKTLDINETFFLTPWYAAEKSDLNPRGVSVQLTHSSVSLRRSEMPILHHLGKKKIKKPQRHFSYPTSSLHLSPLLYHLKCTQCFTQTEEKPIPCFKELACCTACRHCNEVRARLTASQRNLDANRRDC